MAIIGPMTVIIGTAKVVLEPCNSEEFVRKEKYEYYMRRGNKRYFRSATGKYIIEHEGPDPEGLERGMVVEIEINT
jgi:hypothetical protein